MDGFPASHITAVSVPPQRARFTAELVERFPNLSVIDIDAVLKQVRSTADQVSTVVEVVFYFSLAAGLLVLMAAVSASQDERLLEGGVMRAIGGKPAAVAPGAGLGVRRHRPVVGADRGDRGIAAGGRGIATHVFDLPWEPDWRLAAVGAALGVLAALLAGLFATRRVLDAPPSVTLRELQE